MSTNFKNLSRVGGILGKTFDETAISPVLIENIGVGFTVQNNDDSITLEFRLNYGNEFSDTIQVPPSSGLQVYTREFREIEIETTTTSFNFIVYFAGGA